MAQVSRIARCTTRLQQRLRRLLLPLATRQPHPRLARRIQQFDSPGTRDDYPPAEPRRPHESTPTPVRGFEVRLRSPREAPAVRDLCARP